MKPAAIIFDVGAVLLDWQPDRVYATLIPDASVRAGFLRDVVTAEWHFQHDAGRPFADTSRELATQHPDFADEIAVWGPRFAEQLRPMPGMAELVRHLADRGVPLFAITNFSAEFWRAVRADHAALFDRFAGIVVSGEERLTKPDPAIYHLALTRFGLAPAEALFIDDRADNIAAAAALGLATHLFADAGTLRAALLDYGVLDPDMAAT